MLKTKDEIIQWLDKYKIEKYTVNDDLTVDVDGSVWVSNKFISIIPIKFNLVTGYFLCSMNKAKNLEFCPKYVGDSFYCQNNPLKSIKELFDIEIKGAILVPEHLEDSKEYKLLQKIHNLC